MDLIWLRYSGSKKSLFVCLFVDLFVFYFNHLGTPPGIYPENLVKIGLDCFFILIILGHPQEVTLKILWRSDLIWLRYLGSKKMFICLFVCLFVYWFVCFFILIILGNPREYTPKISWGSDLIYLRYLGYNKCLFVCLFV